VVVDVRLVVPGACVVVVEVWVVAPGAWLVELVVRLVAPVECAAVAECVVPKVRPDVAAGRFAVVAGCEVFAGREPAAGWAAGAAFGAAACLGAEFDPC
jgi:hypothetical protein